MIASSTPAERVAETRWQLARLITDGRHVTNARDRRKNLDNTKFALERLIAAVRAEAFEEMATQLQPMMNEHRSDGWRNAMTVAWNIASKLAEQQAEAGP